MNNTKMMRGLFPGAVYMTDINPRSVSPTRSTWPASAARPITDTMPGRPAVRSQLHGDNVSVS